MAVHRHREKRKSKVIETWRYRKTITLPDGSKIRIAGTPDINTRAAAEAAERDHIQRAHNRKAAKPTEVFTFEKFVADKWWPTYPSSVNNRPSTVEEKEIHLRLHLLPRVGALRLEHVQGEQLSKLVASLAQAEMTPKTIRNICATLRKALGSAVEWGYLAQVPTFPKVKVPDPDWDHLSLEEVDRLLIAARDNRDRLLLMFALHTGARAGEQLAVEWGDIDWAKRVVYFKRARTRGETGPTKSGKKREVPLTGTLLAALREFRGTTGLVFCDAHGSPLRIGQLHECMWRSLERAGLRNVRWHDLRHSFASNLAAKGVPIPQIQKWLGHSTIAMTMRYVQFAPDGNRSLIGALDSVPADKELTRETTRTDKTLKLQLEVSDPIGN
jgi:integrase